MHTAQQGLGPHKNHSETLGTAPSHSKGHADGCRCFVGKTKQGKPSSTQARTHTMSTPIPSFIHGNPGLMHFLKKKGTGDRKRTKKGKGQKHAKTGKREIEQAKERKKERKKKRKKESKKERKRLEQQISTGRETQQGRGGYAGSVFLPPSNLPALKVLKLLTSSDHILPRLSWRRPRSKAKQVARKFYATQPRGGMPVTGWNES